MQADGPWYVGQGCNLLAQAAWAMLVSLRLWIRLA